MSRYGGPSEEQVDREAEARKEARDGAGISERERRIEADRTEDRYIRHMFGE